MSANFLELTIFCFHSRPPQSLEPDMKPLSESPFSYNFKMLQYLGSWYYEPRDSPKVSYYVVYRLVVSLTELYGAYGLLMDLYTVMGDIKKMTWNVCVTSLMIGSVSKNFLTLQKYDVLYSLRSGLHEDAESRTAPEDVEIHNDALKELKFLQTTFYTIGIVFIPTWFISRYVGYFWGDRQLPIPFHVPYFFDLNDDVHFHVVYVFLALASIFVMRITMESELSMFGLLVQISREYNVLLKDISKLSELYEEMEEEENAALKNSVVLLTRKEVNPWLRRVKTKMLIRKLSARQNKLFQYIKEFENCFNRPLFQEFFSMSVAIVALALQCLWESIDFFGYIMYQMGYLCITVADLFLLCFFSSRIQTQNHKVGETFYSTLWYRMETGIQKDVGMILMRCQNPPKITIGKFMEFSLQTFMGTMSHLYSWLTLFRQIESSTSA